MILDLKKRLVVWKSEKLISGEQARAIFEFERDSGAPWGMYGIAGIGVTAVMTGIISLVAANWWQMSSPVKLAGYFALQAGIGFLFIRQEKTPGVWREVFLALFALLFFAGIGLVTQIYHLRGDGWQAIALWCAMTLPATLYAQSKPLNHIWIGAALAAAYLWTMTDRMFIPDEKARMMVASSIPIALTGISFLGQRFLPLPIAFQRASVAYGIAFSVFAGAILGNTLWITHPPPLPQDVREYLYIPWATIAFTSLASIARGSETPRGLRFGTALLIILVGAFVTLPLLGIGNQGLPPVAGKIVGALGFIVIGLLAAFTAALGRYRRLYDTATLAVALRILGIYAEVFGTLTTTGIGLIVTGSVFLGVARLWQKYRHRLASWVEGGR